MGEARRPAPVNLICAVLAGRREWLDAAKEKLEKSFGHADLESDVWPFDQTHYYEAEMGPGLLRAIWGFRELIAPENLVAVKHTTNRLEKELARELEGGPARPANLDPGYVSLSKLVLATTKDHAHRLHLGGGIYGEVTLHWHEGAFEPWPWTYADYRSDSYLSFFTRVRQLYQEKLKAP